MKFTPLHPDSWLRHHWLTASVGLALLTALLLPLNLVASQPFHHDEALYATWALKISAGDDPWLTDTPIDKPPLLLYMMATTMRLLGVSQTVARVPSFAATALIVLLTFWLGRQLYSDATGVLAAWLVALSPFMILFTPTAFTDPLLVTLILAGSLAAVRCHAAWAGILLGLAIATKQQGILFLPLVILLLALGFRFQVSGFRFQVSGFSTAGNEVASSQVTSNKSENPPFPIPNLISHIPHHASLLTHPLSRFTAALLLTLLSALIWDLFRSQPSAFFEQSYNNYGGLTTDISGFGERWQGFVDLLYYGTGSPLLNTIFVIGCPLLLIYGLLQLAGHTQKSPKLISPAYTRMGTPLPLRSPTLTDWILFLFSLTFLLLHALFSFQVWDRYLLGLIPLLALLLARVLLLPGRIAKNYGAKLPGLVVGAIIFLLLAFTFPAPVHDAINARYPLGSNSHALQGIEQITAYLQGHVGADNTLYHHWLGTHWRFYLWKYPYDLQYWDSPAELVAKAKPGHLIAYPAWRSDTEVRLALFNAGLGLRPLTRAYVPDGAPSITLYQIESIPQN